MWIICGCGEERSGEPILILSRSDSFDFTERVGGDDRGDDEWSVRGGGEERGGVRSDGERSSRGGGNPDWRGEGDDERIQGSSGVSDDERTSPET